MASSEQPLADISYRLKRQITSKSAKREEMVTDYVSDLTKNFNNSFPKHHHAKSNASDDTVEKKCIVVVTGATGGLGAHLVAEATTSLAVQRVVCLNRRSKQDPFKRQIAALHKQGYDLAPDLIAKLEVHETDLSQPQLGLPLGVYDCLVSKATHIIHNAWLMHSKCAVKRFEPQLRIMSEILHFARDISLRHDSDQLVSLLFISSIATVGYHPFLTGSPIVLEERVPIASVLPTGYGEAKYICERMLDATLHQHPTRFRTATIRLGQIGGSTLNGYWNPMEHISFMIKSSRTLNTLPDLPGSMGWTPADIIAKVVLEIATQPDHVRLYPIYHVENPVRQPWNSVLATLADELDIPRDETGIISLDEWLTRVRHWPCQEDNKLGGKNPAYVLVDFLEDHFIRMSCGGLLMGTANARRHSKTLANTGKVNSELIRLYVQTWKVAGFLV